MKAVTYTTGWGIILKGSEYGCVEFINLLDHHENSRSICFNNQDGNLVFNANDMKREFRVEVVECIQEYIVHEIKYNEYYYIVLCVDGCKSMFQITCKDCW